MKEVDDIELARVADKLGRTEEAYFYVMRFLDDNPWETESTLELFAKVVHDRVESLRDAVSSLCNLSHSYFSATNYTSSQNGHMMQQPKNGYSNGRHQNNIGNHEQTQKERNIKVHKEYLLHVLLELVDICSQVVSLVQGKLFPLAKSEKSRVICLRLIGDFHRYIVETPGNGLKLISLENMKPYLETFGVSELTVTSDSGNIDDTGTGDFTKNLSDMLIDKIEDWYSMAHEEAEKSLTPVDEAFLDVEIVFSQFYSEYKNDMEKAERIARECYLNTKIEIEDQDLLKIAEHLQENDNSTSSLNEELRTKFKQNTRYIGKLKTIYKNKKIFGAAVSSVSST